MTQLQTNLEFTPAQAETVLSAWLAHSVSCTGIVPLSGGMINTVLRLAFDRPPFSAVIKLNAGENNFVQEAAALETLRTHTRFPCPQEYLLDDSTRLIPYAFLLLETLPGASLAGLEVSEADRACLDRQLAEILLELHSHTRATYGELGEGAGQASWPGQTNWPSVFLPRLVQVRGEAEVEQRLPPAALDDIDFAIEITGGALQNAGTPTLIHGDLWDGNLIVNSANGRWRITGIVDPALHYADVEEELAYLEVFNTARQAFFEGYTARSPLRPGYARRRLFYWLHTALIHVWLFGDRHYCEFATHTAAAIRESARS